MSYPTLTEDYNITGGDERFSRPLQGGGRTRKVYGLFGYTAFDAVRYFSRTSRSWKFITGERCPDMLYLLYKYILVFNHFKNESLLWWRWFKTEDSAVGRDPR